MHETYREHGKTETASDKSFGIVFAVVFGLIAALQVYLDHIEWAIGLAGVGALFLIIAYARPRTLAPLNWVWTKFGLLLHKITNPILLGGIFFLVCTPMGVVMRLFGKDPLRLSKDEGADSYWIARDPPGPAPDSMNRQF